MEHKLCRYSGYIHNSFLRWRKQVLLSDPSIRKVIENLKILSSREIRNLLRKIRNSNKQLFKSKKSYICRFGDVGESGDILLYEFSHTFKEYKDKLIEIWQISRLPENSIIIFIDDLVGTGNQSLRYITNRLNQVMNPSHDAYLLCLCATPQGIENVESNSNVSVIPGLILDQENFQYLNNKCNILSDDEKTYLRELNGRLNYPDAGYGDFGLLLSFYFTVPNNTLPFIWKDKFTYQDRDGLSKHWLALLPRDY